MFLRLYAASVLAALVAAGSVFAATPTTLRYQFRNGFDGNSAYVSVVYCGQLVENGEVFLGPESLGAGEPALSDAICDANDSATEGTADEVLSATLTLRPKFMACQLAGTLGAGETLTAQLRNATADVSGVACSMAAGETTCEVKVNDPLGQLVVAAGTTTAVEANEASNNSDDDLICKVIYQVD